MKKPLVILTFLSLLLSPFVFSQSEPGDIIQPLMNCLNAAVQLEKEKPSPSLQGIKDACVNEMQLLAMLPADVRATLVSEIDTGLAQHLAE
jgi:di/tricarboxylate transporter